MKRTHVLENLAGHLHPVALSLNADLTVPRQYLDSQGVANLSQMLVSTTENCQLLGMSLKIDRNFWHASPRADHGEPRASATLRVAPWIPPDQTA